MKPKIKYAFALALLLCTGCAIVSANRTFPKLTWYWSSNAKEQRREREASEFVAREQIKATNVTSLAEQIRQRDGTNYIGVYLGMIAEHDGKGNVAMFSATSGQCLKWISYKEFEDIFILKNRPEYLPISHTNVWDSKSK